MAVGGGSGMAVTGMGTAGFLGSTTVASASPGNSSEPGSRNHPRCMPASRRMPVTLRFGPLIRHHPHQYRSRNRHGARPKPVTQKRALRICESISIHFRRGELMSLQSGLHMAGAALQRRRNNMPPHATTLRPYNVMKKPTGVRNHFQKLLRPIAKACVHGSLGGGT